MSSEEHIKNQMDNLSSYLRQDESLVPGVLERIEKEAVVPKTNVRSARFRFRFAATAAAIVLIGIVAVWMRPSGLGAGIAYAEVRQAIRNIQSAIVDFEHPDQPHNNRRAFFRRDMNTVRLEYPNGFVWVSDGELGRCLVLDELEQAAQVVPGYHEEFSAAKHLDEMASLDRDAVEPVGRRVVDGRTLVGFRVKQPKPDDQWLHHERWSGDTIWVDAETRLPVIREHSRAATNLVKGSSFRQIYTFNKPLAPELFSMTPPDGYQLVSSDAPPIAKYLKPELPAGKLPAGPTLKPLVGIGDVTFGMTVEQIVEVLGKADEISYTRKYTPEESRLIDEAYRKARHLDEFEGQQLIEKTRDKVGAMIRKRKSRPSAARMEYDRLGIELVVSLEEGFRGGFCWSHGGDHYPYTGQTTEGIKIGCTQSEIEKAYGDPDGALRNKIEGVVKKVGALILLGQYDQTDNQHRQSVGLWYESRGLHFQIEEGTVRYITFNRGPDIGKETRAEE